MSFSDLAVIFLLKTNTNPGGSKALSDSKATPLLGFLCIFLRRTKNEYTHT